MKKILLVLCSVLVLALLIAGCGGSETKSEDGKTVLKVGATPVPHAELLNFVKPQLAKEGVDLQIIEFSDYVKPNLSLNDKEIDANFFQHIPYLEPKCISSLWAFIPQNTNLLTNCRRAQKLPFLTTRPTAAAH